MSGRVAYSESLVVSRSMFPYRISFSGRGIPGQSWRVVLGHHCDVFICVLLTIIAERVFSTWEAKAGPAATVIAAISRAAVKTKSMRLMKRYLLLSRAGLVTARLELINATTVASTGYQRHHPYGLSLVNS